MLVAIVGIVVILLLPHAHLRPSLARHMLAECAERRRLIEKGEFSIWGGGSEVAIEDITATAGAARLRGDAIRVRAAVRLTLVHPE
jgi:hypothetical protein